MIAQSWKDDGRLAKPGIVATVMSNLGLERFLQAQGIALKRTPVGDRYVVEEMRRNGGNLGGKGFAILGLAAVILWGFSGVFQVGNEGDIVLVEDPTYFVYLSILQSRGLRARESGNNKEYAQDQPATPRFISHTSAPIEQPAPLGSVPELALAIR